MVCQLYPLFLLVIYNKYVLFIMHPLLRPPLKYYLHFHFCKLVYFFSLCYSIHILSEISSILVRSTPTPFNHKIFFKINLFQNIFYVSFLCNPKSINISVFNVPHLFLILFQFVLQLLIVYMNKKHSHSIMCLNMFKFKEIFQKNK